MCVMLLSRVLSTCVIFFIPSFDWRLMTCELLSRMRSVASLLKLGIHCTTLKVAIVEKFDNFASVVNEASS